MIKQFIITNLLTIHRGTFVAKIKSTLALAFATSPMAYVFEQVTKWTITNSVYVEFVLFAIIIDHLLGTIIHAFIKKDFTLKKNVIGLITKIGLAITMGLLFEGINHIVKEASFVKEYLIVVLRLTVFLYPAGSAFMNSSIITKGKFPPIGIINKIKSFQENSELKEFKKEAEK